MPGTGCSSMLLSLTGKENEQALSPAKFCTSLTWFSVSDSYTLQLCINRKVRLLKYPEALLGYLTDTIMSLQFELIRWKHQREVIGIYVFALLLEKYQFSETFTYAHVCWGEEWIFSLFPTLGHIYSRLFILAMSSYFNIKPRVIPCPV